MDNVNLSVFLGMGSSEWGGLYQEHEQEDLA